MALLVKPDIPMNQINNVLQGYKEMKILFAAIELNIFSVLTKEITFNEAAKKLKLNPRNMEFFLNALVAMEFIKKRDGLYQNGEYAKIYLVKGSDLYLGDYFLFREEFTGIKNLKHNLLNGPDLNTLVENKGKNVFNFAKLAELSANEQRSGRANIISENITKLFRDRKFNKMIDLGGGSGVVALAIAEKNPKTECFIFEIEEVAVATDKTINVYAKDNRPKVLRGDYTTDNIGNGYDLVLAVASIQFAKEHFASVLKKIHSSLNENGLFISICKETTDEKTKPKDLVLGWLGSHMEGLNVLPEEGELKKEILKYGFEFVELSSGMGISKEMNIFKRSSS